MEAMKSAQPTGRHGHPLLELEGVSMTYTRSNAASIHLLNGMNLTVQKGELVAVGGRSGSGKTTLLNIAAGLLRPTTGSVRWSGGDTAGLSRDELARQRGHFIGISFQNGSLIETLTVAENVALAGVGSGAGVNRDRVSELLERVGLADRGRHFPARLSGGEQQRVALARALYANPPLLLIDEPTANLDRRTADELIVDLAGLADRRQGLLVASHDPNLRAAATRSIELEPFPSVTTWPS